TQQMHRQEGLTARPQGRAQQAPSRSNPRIRHAVARLASMEAESNGEDQGSIYSARLVPVGFLRSEARSTSVEAGSGEGEPKQARRRRAGTSAPTISEGAQVWMGEKKR